MDSTLLKLIFLLLAAALCGGRENWECDLPCKCKWVTGKKTAECIKLNFTEIPNYLPDEIQNLELTGNRLRDIPKDAFYAVGLINLHKLVLRECGIETVHTEAFNGLGIVIVIDLSVNKIKTLHPGTFHETLRLRALLLNENRIERLEDGLFHNLTYLQKVEISDNKLDHIGQRTFLNLPGLQSLGLGGNRLTNLKRETFDDLPKLGSIVLRDNPWNCDCHLKDFRDWSIQKNIYTKPTACDQPANLTRRMWDDVKSEHFACRPEILFTGPASRIEVGPGDVTLSCNVSGNPLPQVTWIYRTRILNNGTRRYNGDSGGYVLLNGGNWVNLTIPNATSADKGDYICQAMNPGGLEERNVSLNVIGDVVGNNESAISIRLNLAAGASGRSESAKLLQANIELKFRIYILTTDNRTEKRIEIPADDL